MAKDIHLRERSGLDEDRATRMGYRQVAAAGREGWHPRPVRMSCRADGGHPDIHQLDGPPFEAIAVDPQVGLVETLGEPQEA